MKTVISTEKAPAAIGPYSQGIQAGSLINNFAAMNGVYATFFEGACPARSAVEVARLPKDALVEIECIAVL